MHFVDILSLMYFFFLFSLKLNKIEQKIEQKLNKIEQNRTKSNKIEQNRTKIINKLIGLILFNSSFFQYIIKFKNIFFFCYLFYSIRKKNNCF